MLRDLIDSLAHRLAIDHALAQQTLAMMLEALHENDEGELASVLESRIPELGNIEAAGSGGGGFGLAGEASGLVSGTPGSGVRGLRYLLGEVKAPKFAEAAGTCIGEQTEAALGAQVQDVLKRII